LDAGKLPRRKLGLNVINASFFQSELVAEWHWKQVGTIATLLGEVIGVGICENLGANSRRVINTPCALDSFGYRAASQSEQGNCPQ
jgi:hypothetical protein